MPGVSVARLALEHGLNANLLRSWVSAYKRKCDGTGVEDREADGGGVHTRDCRTRAGEGGGAPVASPIA
ncbi:hypothetical protein PAMC26510_22035 [Caballeronia sordidicola]|uniref:Transposase n=1 Tax=Caballeronia sordidicola TaxID=196367 RepID=A0A242MLW7_CABSO|nr:hypothetical protein PAMC26510_22035 [Caballeronia sordidicola]